MKLMLVESPNKAKTLNAMLRSQGIIVRATFGHFRSLDVEKPREEVVDIKHGFKLKFKDTEQNKKQIKEIETLAKKADEIIVASDPDREGEAIAWHVYEKLKKWNVKVPVKRVTYQEVTPTAVMKAIDLGGELNMNMVNAAFVRQGLDYLVGYYISPLLWRKVSRGLSAGRVQSPALRMIAERCKEISDFIPEKYWKVSVVTSKDKVDFFTNMTHWNNEKLDPIAVNTEELAAEIEKTLKDHQSKGNKLKVTNVNIKQVTRKPKPPYITSTLQIDGIRKLGLSSKKVMTAAQRLFEGNGGEHGFITYMRTDSTALSEEALIGILLHGNKAYKGLMSNSPIRYGKSTKNAQEAHEAIRPTDMELTPEKLAKMNLGRDEVRLYEMIWQRTMASQMKPAIYEATAVEFNIGKVDFKSTGQVPVFLGFQTVYTEGKDLEKEDEDKATLPKMKQGDLLPILEVISKPSETKPPSFYNEGTLVASLEKYGIGRPSTYASIFETLMSRQYIRINQKRIEITVMGMAVNAYLVDRFLKYVSYDYTSGLEDELDKIANNEVNHETVMHAFWKPFIEKVNKESAEIKEGTAGLLETTTEVCPTCGVGHVTIMVGKFGKYKSCSEYKTCKYRENMSEKVKEPLRYVEPEENCPECSEGKLVYKKGFKGRDFIGCSCYPNCKYIKSDKPKAEVTDVDCPKCKKNKIVKRHGARGPFFACSGFPKCKHILSTEEVDSHGLKF